MACGHAGRFGGRGSAGLGVLNILQDDAAVGTGAFEGRKINALLLGNALGKGGSENAGAIGLWLWRAAKEQRLA